VFFSLKKLILKLLAMCAGMQRACLFACPGLPDFSLENIPKWENMTTKYTKSPLNTTKGLKMAIRFTNIFHSRAFKYVDTKIGIFWYANIPSGNPANA
jgi:uncharacterized membrane protein